AEHAAIDVNIAVGEPRHDLLDGGIDAGMDAEREPIAVGGNLLEQRVKLPRTPAHDVQDRSEHLFTQLRRALEHDDGGRHVGPARRQRLESVPTEAQAALSLVVADPAAELVLGLGIDHRPTIAPGSSPPAPPSLAPR